MKKSIMKSEKLIKQAKAYIVGAYRSPITKAHKGKFRFMRPDDLSAQVIKHLMSQFPQLEKNKIDDVIVGNATPEAEQGLNLARYISLLALDNVEVAGMTVNRYCASGLEAIAIASSKISNGLADIIVAGGVEMMSSMPMGGWRIVPNSRVAQEHPDYYWNMGLTAEAVAKAYKVNREDQDKFALSSHRKAIKAINENRFLEELVPIKVNETLINKQGEKYNKEIIADSDEGARADTDIKQLSILKSVFAAKGSVTAGNSSQTSDGAAFTLIVSEKILKEFKLEPIACMKTYAVAGVEPKHMGIGPIAAIPKALKKADMKIQDIQLIELNEAFASQSLAVIRELNLDPTIVNVNGGAIALGHPLGATGAKLTVQLLHEMKKRKQKYGMVTMCVGTGQGAAGIFEMM